jgi:hypothetical protein
MKNSARIQNIPTSMIQNFIIGGIPQDQLANIIGNDQTSEEHHASVLFSMYENNE